MTFFTVRIELKNGLRHNTENDSYRVLDKEMKKRKFKTTISGLPGKVFELPRAEYIYQGDEDLDGVFQLALSATKKTSGKYSIIVDQIVRSRWTGLDDAYFIKQLMDYEESIC
ncbi:hypothetical protein LEP1GSC050_4308 [Leptospira broomii serovar Hurstbridge str. 5399]|uniref:Uncharacterized protein n=1 Tax=Leptospira broomii serovar Hurstbridge str. 5399 TaxID=1049789 RepID=T0FCB5_9LEPT|nr:hypothetical protein [Leptospira broomii]EQA45232.1 hypothetical protein LEP1GSC050_4308 [Leptospira broomii serovar Hurstbridge str. 5399]